MKILLINYLGRKFFGWEGLIIKYTEIHHTNFDAYMLSDPQ